MKKGLTGILSAFLLVFYMGIIMYVFFSVLHIEALINFESAMVFEIIGFLFLIYFTMSNLLSKSIKLGYFVPLVIVTVIYTVILDVINIVCVVAMPHAYFVLLNLVLLFIYCLVSLPMYIMGKR